MPCASKTPIPPHAPASTASTGIRLTRTSACPPAGYPTTRRTLKIPTIIGTTLNLPSPGVAEFTLEGKTLRLEPVIEGDNQTVLFFILRDQTSQSTTYEAARFLHTGLPDHGLTSPGHLELDFNQLENPPCAYTSYATCPLPPQQNRLQVSIPAGEERYPH